MYVYHEIASDNLGSVLVNGLKTVSYREKGSDVSIMKTDAFLNGHCPDMYKKQGVNRDKNIYAYFSYDDIIIDIVNGTEVPVGDFIIRSSRSVLRLKVDPNRCYVSDLDTYDALRLALENDAEKSKLDQLADSYWKKVTVLSKFSPGIIKRPEIMIPYDVEPVDIQHASLN